MTDQAPKIWSPAEKAAMTTGRIAGRITARQLRFLEQLGVDPKEAMTWTKHRASKEISKHLKHWARV
jgi:hypothetical protein